MTQEKLTYLISCTLPSGSVIHGRIKLYLIWIFFRAFYGLYSNIFAFTVVGLANYPYLIKEGRKMLSFSGAALFLGCEITVKCSEAGDALSPSVNTDWSSNFSATSRGPEFVDLQWRQLGICIFFWEQLSCWCCRCLDHTLETDKSELRGKQAVVWVLYSSPWQGARAVHVHIVYSCFNMWRPEFKL